eukprot:3602547-Amphidinium_carterae.1
MNDAQHRLHVRREVTSGCAVHVSPACSGQVERINAKVSQHIGSLGIVASTTLCGGYRHGDVSCKGAFGPNTYNRIPIRTIAPKLEPARRMLQKLVSAIAAVPPSRMFLHCTMRTAMTLNVIVACRLNLAEITTYYSVSCSVGLYGIIVLFTRVVAASRCVARAQAE